MSPRTLLLLALSSITLGPNAFGQYVQQGGKLLGGPGSLSAAQGWAVAVSANGNTAVIGGPHDGFPSLGSAWIFTRANGAWTQQGPKLVGTGIVGNAFSGVNEGAAVAISADGNTVILGGYGDNNNQGAAWIFTRTGTTWSQQGPKLTGSGTAGTFADFGNAVALSADGNTAIVGSLNDSNGIGAAWIFKRAGGVWTQVGGKLVATDSVGQSFQGQSVALSSDGTTALVGGFRDNGNTGAAWVYTFNGGVWTQQGGKLTGSGSTQNSLYGFSAALSSDGATAIVGGYGDNGFVGAAWVYTRAGGVWSEQSKLTASDSSGTAQQGRSVSISGDGNIAVVGGPAEGANVGAFWVYKRAGGAWSQQGAKLAGGGATPPNLEPGQPGYGTGQGAAVAISSDGSTIIEGAPSDNLVTGATWIFTQSQISATAPVSASPGSGSSLSQNTMTFTFVDPRGWQDLDVVNVLINNFLDGRNACYLAYSRPSAVLYLVSDAGGGLSAPLTLGPSGSISNGQCTVSGAGSSATGSGNALTLTLNISFNSSFAGNRVSYLAARDLQGGNSGWQALGTWSVPGATTVPGVTGVSPPRGAGSSGTFTFTFTDTKGSQDLGVLNVLINDFLDGRKACYLAYSRPAGVLYLVGDAGGGLSAPLTLGASGSIGNSQCSINSAGSSATSSGNTFTLILNISFTGAFNGNRVVYLAARDASETHNSDWQSMGSWTVQ